jgi:hypothetical protein
LATTQLAAIGWAGPPFAGVPQPPTGVLPFGACCAGSGEGWTGVGVKDVCASDATHAMKAAVRSFVWQPDAAKTSAAKAIRSLADTHLPNAFALLGPTP